MANDISCKVVKDFGGFGDGRWQMHLVLVEWNEKEAKYDIRSWNDDMSKCSKGVCLTLEELMDLKDLIEKAIDEIA